MLRRLLFVAALAASIAMAEKPTPIVFDTDIGDDIDDALALSLALQSPELDIRAITTVLEAGDRRADIVYRILELYDRTEIPVGVGAQQTLLGPPSNAIPVQVSALPAGFRMPAAKRHNGVQLLIDTCLRSPEKITLVAVGPLTNVALALRSEPRIKEHIDRIVLMNGVFFRAGLEYNVWRDAEASAIVYSSGLPISTVGLDVTLQCKLNAEQVQRFQESQIASVHFLGQLIHAWQNGKSTQYPTLHDPLAILSLVRPSLITRATGAVRIETHGTPGLTQGLSAFREDPAGQTQVGRAVDAPGAVNLFLERLLAAPRSPARMP